MLPSLISPSVRATLHEVVSGLIKAQCAVPCENIRRKIFSQHRKTCAIKMYLGGVGEWGGGGIRVGQGHQLLNILQLKFTSVKA